MKRRQFTSPSALDLSNPSPQSASQLSSRAGSPSVFGAFLRGPTTRWFSKGRPASKSSDSDSSARQLPPSPRRPIISQPSDPRPLLDIPRATHLQSSRFVLASFIQKLISLQPARSNSGRTPISPGLVRRIRGIHPPGTSLLPLLPQPRVEVVQWMI